MIRYFSFFLLSICSLPLAAQTNLYGIEASKQYAEHLYNSAEFANAAIEYERLILLDSNNIKTHAFKALVCYRRAEQIAIGTKRFNALFPDKENLNYPLNKEFSLYLTGQGFYKDAIDYLGKLSDIPKSEIVLLQAINHSYLSNWEEAQQLVDQLNVNSLTKEVLEVALTKATALKLKKPGLAATLSIVPGLGRVYTGNYIDAGLSVLTIGTFAWQAYTGFDKNGINSAYGWITGGVTAGFYLGNIYGSYRAAQLYNKQKLEEILYEVNRAYSLIS